LPANGEASQKEELVNVEPKRATKGKNKKKSKSEDGN
jgi:hypothetical protein